MSVSSPRLLRFTLLANAGASFASGLACAAFAAPIALLMAPVPLDVLGQPLADLLRLVGLAVAAFGVAVWFVGREARPNVGLSRLIFWADVAWVVASVAILALFAPALTWIGVAVVAVPAALVADFAIGEWLGLRRMAAA